MEQVLFRFGWLELVKKRYLKFPYFKLWSKISSKYTNVKNLRFTKGSGTHNM